MSKLTIKQKRFADEYISSGNMFQSALTAGYSQNYAKAQSSKLLENVGIQNYIEARMKVLEDQSIAKQDEVLKYLTSLMRGEQKEETLRGIGEGAQRIDDIDVSAKDRIKAAELLGKRYSMWIDKKELRATFDGVTKLDKIIEQLTDDDAEITEDDL